MNSLSKNPHLNFKSRQDQHGAVLFVVLALLVIITILAITGTKTQVLETRMAGNVQNQNLALQSSEAGLRYAENNIQDGIYSNFSSNSNGLFQFDPNIANTTLAYLGINFTAPGSAVVPYAGPTLTANVTAAPASVLVQQLPPVAVPGQSLSQVQYGAAAPPVQVFMVTSYSVGGDNNSKSTVQSIYH